jgi:hypothetical protein
MNICYDTPGTAKVAWSGSLSAEETTRFAVSIYDGAAGDLAPSLMLGITSPSTKSRTKIGQRRYAIIGTRSLEVRDVFFVIYVNAASEAL